jgi:hypothetical protein
MKNKEKLLTPDANQNAIEEKPPVDKWQCPPISILCKATTVLNPSINCFLEKAVAGLERSKLHDCSCSWPPCVTTRYIILPGI